MTINHGAVPANTYAYDEVWFLAEPGTKVTNGNNTTVTLATFTMPWTGKLHLDAVLYGYHTLSNTMHLSQHYATGTPSPTAAPQPYLRAQWTEANYGSFVIPIRATWDSITASTAVTLSTYHALSSGNELHVEKVYGSYRIIRLS